MHLEKLKLTNYKSFLELTEFNFQPGFNVLLGANSSGKSSVLEAIAFNDFMNIPHRSILNTENIESPTLGSSTTEVRFSASLQQLSVLAKPIDDLYICIGDNNGKFHSEDLNLINSLISKQSLFLDIKSSPGIGGLEAKLNISRWPTAWRNISGTSHFQGVNIRNMEAIQVANFNSGAADLLQIWEKVPKKIYKFSAERAVQNLSSHYSSSELLPNASNLAYCIAFLSTSNPALFEDLNNLMHRVFPTIYWVGAPPNGSNQFELKVHTNPISMKRSDLAVPINRVGTGVGNALAMLYVALTAQTQRYILLEEPNSYLHPRALRELLAILSEIGEKHQFFITTHSNDVLRTINASTVTLLEYDGQQTTIKQTTGDKLQSLHAGLLDLGITLTDLHGCDKIIWVEGETEAAIFPLLLRYFYPKIAQGVAVLPLHATGDFEAKKYEAKKVAAIYRKLSEGSFLAPPMLAIALDRERKSNSQIKQIESECAGTVYFLPKTMLEDYLLEPEAIAFVLNQEANIYIPHETIINALKSGVLEKSCQLKSHEFDVKIIHAAKVLNYVFYQVAQIEYKKTKHGPKIVEWLIDKKPEALEPLNKWMDKFIN